MAVNKGSGTVKNNRESHSKRLGVKRQHLQIVNAGEIIVLQTGASKKAGANTYLGRTYNIHATISGRVMYKRKSGFTYVTVQPT